MAQEATAEAVVSPQAGRDAGRLGWRRSQREAPPPSITLVKVAARLCGNLLACVLRVWDFAREEAWKRKKPVLLVPVMNTLMWRGGGVQRWRGANPVAVFLLWEQGRAVVSDGGGGRCRPGNVWDGGPARTQGSVEKRSGEERARRCAADVSGGFLLLGVDDGRGCGGCGARGGRGGVHVCRR